MIGMVFCLTRRTRLSGASGAASAVTRMVIECLRCLTHFQVLQLRDVSTVCRSLSLYIFLLIKGISEAPEANAGNPRQMVVLGCLGLCDFFEADEAGSEAVSAATAVFSWSMK